MKNKLKLDPTRLLLFATLAISIPRYIGAFISADAGSVTGWLSTALTYLMPFTGVGMGLVEVFGMAVILNGWRRKKYPSKAYLITLLILALTTISSLIILVPFGVSRVLGLTVGQALGAPVWVWFWQVFINLDPLLILFGVVYVNTDLFTDTSDTPPKRVSHKTTESVTMTDTPANDKPVSVKKTDTPADTKKRVGTMTDFMRWVSDNPPDMSVTEIVARFGVRDRTAYRWLKKLEEKKDG